MLNIVLSVSMGVIKHKYQNERVYVCVFLLLLQMCMHLYENATFRVNVSSVGKPNNETQAIAILTKKEQLRANTVEVV